MRTRRHALGQNFLHHRPTIAKIAALVEARATGAKTLLEVGPGKLALTKALDPIAKAHGMPLVLVERDRYLEEGLRSGAPEAELHFMDAATELLPGLLDELSRAGRAPILVASNLPYSAASQILANFCHRSRLVSAAVVMVQKEMARRIAAPAGSTDRGALSLLIQSYFKVRHEFDVGPGAFSPPPRVMSAVLTLEPLPEPATARVRDPLKFERFCKTLFSQRRKMIRKLIPPEKHQLFPKLGISGTERPESLELETILRLFIESSEEGI